MTQVKLDFFYVKTYSKPKFEINVQDDGREKILENYIYTKGQ